MLRKILIFGNSGSGKSTLAQELKKSAGLEHLDLDELAWLNTDPPGRAPIAESRDTIEKFIRNNKAWVVEGCYTDLLELLVCEAKEIIYMNLPVEQCLQNARGREWEPHKYPSREAQDKNLNMLLAWIKDYESRDDAFSCSAHMELYKRFNGSKKMYVDNARGER